MAPRAFRIALLSQLDPHDVRAWSGLAHFTWRALQEHVGEVTAFVQPPEHGAWLRRAGERARYVLHTQQALRPERFDVTFVLASPSIAALVPRRLPLVYANDITWQAFEDYYPRTLGPAWRRRVRRALERRAIRRTDLLLYSSQWAADSALRDYGVPSERVEVLPFGANLALTPPRVDPERRCAARVLQLLFLGVSWERKGGPLALDAVVALNRRGVPAHLTVCGCEPPPGLALPACVSVVPFLDKGVPADVARLDALLREAHFLLLPTRAEAMGLVFCEASAYGLPSVSTRTGGVPSVVEEGVNGHLLPLDAPGEAYAQVLEAAWRDREGYARLSRQARVRFEERLSWSAWGRGVHAALSRRFPLGLQRAARGRSRTQERSRASA
ncbi:glycosyltransferase family 4 protein [Aggregicoccus sp. 17bor-14]|uniref:glycosyltransferase family 4 protein n=1 Tax=Myxococcaceae TaxID=31 RepID=UPI00129C18D6|nr:MULTISPECIES: glycosyltransferase family 4 protein [Myxococcaceae]MBF5044339.1 glycosyltransferase family 4 protein [Simulacricoccus sp. 17bor-14]MRI90086.1 glycosyltransferase family 4 protein [Aggregicoccus sp. 17bor-14]